jgi:hypothetical protein
VTCHDVRACVANAAALMALSFHTVFNVVNLSLTLLAMLCARLSPTPSYTYGYVCCVVCVVCAPAACRPPTHSAHAPTRPHVCECRSLRSIALPARAHTRLIDGRWCGGGGWRRYQRYEVVAGFVNSACHSFAAIFVFFESAEHLLIESEAPEDLTRHTLPPPLLPPPFPLPPVGAPPPHFYIFYLSF